jgi:two-component system, LuxR family, sensor kinase FixL
MLWSMCAAACFMLGMIQVITWYQRQWKTLYLLSFSMAAAASVSALFELSMMFTMDMESYQVLFTLHTICIFFVLISLVLFARSYLGAGSQWILVAIITLWSIQLLSNVFFQEGPLYLKVLDLERVETFWGEAFAFARIETNPMKYMTDAASVLILIYLMQSTWVAWRHGIRQRAIVVGGGAILFITIAGIHTPLVDAGLVLTPYMISFAYLAIVAALTYQFVSEAERDRIDLQRTRREIERLTRIGMLGEVAAGIAHELNQPLTAILSNAQAARRFLSLENPDLDEVRDIVDDIITDDKRAGGVIHGLRAMFNRDETLPDAANVNGAIRLVSEILTGELRTNNVALETEMTHGLPAVIGDEVQIQQVVMNLILNAMHAMSDTPDDARRIVVRTLAGDGEVLITVTDTGPGISPDELPRLFEPFYTMQKDGLGVGLAICSRIVERHGGRIWAEANPDAGATFNFTLPTQRGIAEKPA